MIRGCVAISSIALLLTIGCSSGPRVESGWCHANSDARVVVIFWDRSASAADSPSTAVFVDSLRQTVEAALRCPGNSVSAFLVHARTPGKAHRVRAANDLELPPVSGPRNRVKRDSIQYELKVSKLVQSTWTRFAALIDSTQLSAGLTSRTDLLGSLEVLTSELADAPNHARKLVYYFSDMYESMTGPGRRDFDKRPPRSYAEAEEWARTDLDFVRREMNVDPDSFSGVEVRILTEGLANRPNADQVRHYWEVLLSELGNARVRFN